MKPFSLFYGFMGEDILISWNNISFSCPMIIWNQTQSLLRLILKGSKCNLVVIHKIIWFTSYKILTFTQVTKHEDAPESEWRHWNWRSEGDLMLNGAYFRQSGAGASSSYARAYSLSARPSSLVGSMTLTSGVLNCRKGSRC